MTEPMSGRASACVDPDCRFTVRTRFDEPLSVVEMSGELDLASRTAAIHGCTSVDQLDVLVDLSSVVFMDCAGYGALETANTILERRGGSLVLMNPLGEPLRLLALIEQLELRAIEDGHARSLPPLAEAAGATGSSGVLAGPSRTVPSTSNREP